MREKRPWRQHLTKDEARELRPIETEMGKLRKRLSWLAWRRTSIQNRATVRAGAKAALAPGAK